MGNGDIGNQGVHEMDIARWAIKDATLPSEVWSLGGRFGYKDQGQTPNTQMSVYKFGDVTLLFEVRGLVDGKVKEKWPAKVTNEFYTTEGMIKGGKFYPNGGKPAEEVKFDGDAKITKGGAFGAWVTALRSRKPEDINCDAEVAHYSAALCHLGNISYRLGTSVPFSKENKTLGDNAQVVESFNTIRENIKAVDVDLDETNYQLGRVLKFDAKAEKFTGDDEANKLLTRDYRAPFVVPKEV
jgi:hypothetical protein